MKKLMIAAAIVCAAAMSQAASCSWNIDFAFTGEEGSPSYINVDSAGTYWLVSLVGNDTTGLGVDADGKLVLGEGMSQLQTGSYSDGSLMKTTTGFSSADNGKYLALVMYDTTDKMYGVSDAEKLTGIVDDPPTDADSITFKNGYFTADDYNMNGMQLNQTAAVPEPTSGLLLLLGVGALALRRRRA